MNYRQVMTCIDGPLAGLPHAVPEQGFFAAWIKPDLPFLQAVAEAEDREPIKLMTFEYQVVDIVAYDNFSCSRRFAVAAPSGWDASQVIGHLIEFYNTEMARRRKEVADGTR